MAKTDNLITSIYFQSPVYHIEIPEWVKHIDKVCDKYIKQSKLRLEPTIKDREKRLKKKVGDIGLSYHSESMIGDPELKEFQDYVGATSKNILDHFGYDLTNYELMWTEFWVQQFAKKGGGHHEGHIHYDNHISGFYFLRCSERTSVPYFKDPRLCKVGLDMPQKDPNGVSMASPLIHYKPKPGTLILFPSYLEHGFTVDSGVDDYRFIHVNLQAVRKIITNHFKEYGKQK
jgi:uncharacterized protein (TIGR02466 family)